MQENARLIGRHMVPYEGLLPEHDSEPMNPRRRTQPKRRLKLGTLSESVRRSFKRYNPA